MEQTATPQKWLDALNKCRQLREHQTNKVKTLQQLEFDLSFKLQDSVDPNASNVSYSDRDVRRLRRCAEEAQRRGASTFKFNDKTYATQFAMNLTDWYMRRAC